MHNEELRFPGEEGAKLPHPLPPLPRPGDGGGGAGNVTTPGRGPGDRLVAELDRAWADYMIQGFQQNRIMFEKTLKSFTKPYWLTVWLYAFTFLVGIGLFVTAAIVGVSGGSSVTTLAFCGMGVATFVGFFIQRPLQSLEENLQFITVLGVAFNTYWTKLLYMQDPATVKADLSAADAEFRTAMEKLIDMKAMLQANRSGAQAGK
jgi:hypothetical protein